LDDINIFASGARVSLVGKILGRFFHMGGQIILARFLGPASYGLYSIGWTILRMVGIVGPLGLEQGVLRFSPTYDREHPEGFRSTFSQSLITSIVSGFIIGAVFYWTAPWLAIHLFQKPDLGLVIKIFALAFPLLCGLRVAASATRISQQMQYSIYSEEIGQPIVNLILILLFLAFGLSLIKSVIAGIVSFAVAFLLASYYVLRLFTESFKAAGRVLLANKELLAYSIPTALSGIFSTAILLIDRLFIGIFRPESEAGIYQAISLFPLIFVTILSATKNIFAPMIIRLYSTDQKGRFNQLFRLSTKWGLYLSMPLLLVIAISPKDVIELLFGHAYNVGYLALSILIIGQFINIATGPVDIVLMMTGHQNDWLIITAGVFAANIILDILLIPSYGYLGAALSVTAAISAIYLVALLRVKRVFNIFPYNFQYIKGVVSTFLTFIILTIVSHISIAYYLRVLILILIGFLVFFSCLYMLGLSEEDRMIFSTFTRSLSLIVYKNEDSNNNLPKPGGI
jgi:O-antigen/teichoic acid export membrane protein